MTSSIIVSTPQVFLCVPLIILFALRNRDIFVRFCRSRFTDEKKPNLPYRRKKIWKFATT